MRLPWCDKIRRLDSPDFKGSQSFVLSFLAPLNLASGRRSNQRAILAPQVRPSANIYSSNKDHCLRGASCATLVLILFELHRDNGHLKYIVE